VPLYTLSEASKYLIVPRATLATWADGYERRPATRSVVKGEPIITAFPQERRGYARLPFIGIAEAYVLNAFRRAGVPMQRIRPSIGWLIKNVGPNALASEDLFTDGAEVLWRFAQKSGEGSPDDQVVKGLVVPRSGQYVGLMTTSSLLQLDCRNMAKPTSCSTHNAATANPCSTAVGSGCLTYLVLCKLGQHFKMSPTITV
jgi:hypothetical protein